MSTGGTPTPAGEDRRLDLLFAGLDRVRGRPVGELVREALGRPPRSLYEVVWWAPDGYPGVLANPPFLDDGTPMPTRWWLVEPVLVRLIGRIEASGGVRAAEEAVGEAAVELTHRRYAAARDALVPQGTTGPRPAGGVGGARRGVKCLHAHYAHLLAGGDDPVGEWVHERLVTMAGA